MTYAPKEWLVRLPLFGFARALIRRSALAPSSDGTVTDGNDKAAAVSTPPGNP